MTESKSITTTTEVTPQLVIDMFSGGNSDKITEAEAKLFIEQCRQLGANPLTREAYLVKYKGAPAQMLTSVELYKKRAFKNPDFHQLTSGITVRHADGTREQMRGTCWTPEDGKLIGGWASVLVARHGEYAETFKEVSLAEYNKGQGLWTKLPATMIAKVAIGQALREAFPDELNNTYIKEEYDPEPIDVTPKADPHTAAQRVLAKTPAKETASLPEPATEPVQAAETAKEPEKVETAKTTETKKTTARKPVRPEDIPPEELPFPPEESVTGEKKPEYTDPATVEWLELAKFIRENGLTNDYVKWFAEDQVRDKSAVKEKNLDEYPYQMLVWLNSKHGTLKDQKTKDNYKKNGGKI